MLKFPLKTTEESKVEIVEIISRLAATNEISVIAAVDAVSSALDGIFVLNVLTLLPTGFGKTQ